MRTTQKRSTSPDRERLSSAPRFSLHHILVPLDFSGMSRQALTCAVPLARQHHAKISLIHVALPPMIVQAYPDGGMIVPVASEKMAAAAKAHLNLLATQLSAGRTARPNAVARGQPRLRSHPGREGDQGRPDRALDDRQFRTQPRVAGQHRRTHRASRSSARQEMPRLAQRLVPPSLQVTSLVGHGRAAGVIVETAERNHIDLIVLSTHGHTGLDRLLLGSTAEHVVRQAKCPVFVVRQSRDRNQNAAEKG